MGMGIDFLWIFLTLAPVQLSLNLKISPGGNLEEELAVARQMQAFLEADSEALLKTVQDKVGGQLF